MKIFIENNRRQKNETIDIFCDTQEECELIQDMLSNATTLPSIDDMYHALTESRNRLDRLIRRIGKSRV